MIDFEYQDSLRLRKFQFKRKDQKILEACFSHFIQENFPFQAKYAQRSKMIFQISLLIIGQVRMKKLNLTARNKNYATDVLSFPNFQNFRQKSDFKADLVENPILHLGDIVVCSDICRRQAAKHKISYGNELIHLFTHGFLHLLGFDHEISLNEEKIMQRHEDQILDMIQKF